MPRPSRPEDLFHPLPHPVETIANLDAIPIRECGEPLVGIVPVPGLRVPRPMRLREGAYERLVRSAKRAHDEGIALSVFDAYRSPGRQRATHAVARVIVRTVHPTWPRAMIRELANKYVAAPDAIAPPPHTTGGAIDVRLVDAKGRSMRMGLSALTDAPSLTPEARANRRRLRACLESEGFSNYEEEWWHWSHGDSGWALRTGAPHAIYGRTS